MFDGAEVLQRAQKQVGDPQLEDAIKEELDAVERRFDKAAQSQRQQGRLDYMVEQPALDQYEGVEKVLEHVALSPGSLPGPGQGGETEAPRCEAAEQVVECRRKGVLA